MRAALGTAKSADPPLIEGQWREGWKALAELGVTGFCVPEDKGGFGLRVEAAAAAAEELGGALHGSPYAGLTASVSALARADDPACDDLVAGILAGEQLCSYGILDRSTGFARLVDGAPEAEALLIWKPSTDDLVLLTDRSGWAVHRLPDPFDVSRPCADVAVHLGQGCHVGGAVQARRLYGLLLAADALGCVRRMLDRTVAYVGEREAFGRRIGGFQAVQHRLVDHTVRARGMGLVVVEAARELAESSPDAARLVALAEICVSSCAVHILHDLVQLTGAVGFTWEYGLHLYERRAHHDARLAGNPRAAVRSLAVTEGWSSAG